MTNLLYRYLKSPTDNQLEEELRNSDTLFWIDWREYDEDVVQMVNHYLKDADQIAYQILDCPAPRGFDLLLRYHQKEVITPYLADGADRDTTLRTISQLISVDYSLRWYMASLGSDTLAFCLLPNETWRHFEETFSQEHVYFYFAPVINQSMFNLSMEAVFALLEQRKRR